MKQQQTRHCARLPLQPGMSNALQRICYLHADREMTSMTLELRVPRSQARQTVKVRLMAESEMMTKVSRHPQGAAVAGLFSVLTDLMQHVGSRACCTRFRCFRTGSHLVKLGGHGAMQEK